MQLSRNSFDLLVREITDAGSYAADRQHKATRDYKPDGSVLTEIDTYLDKKISESISGLFPGSRIISEENPAETSGSSDWTFTIDPIDGTDSYSQNMPGWCVAVGILNKDMVPSGGIIYAPNWGAKGGTLLTLFPGEELMVNSMPYSVNKSRVTASGKPFHIMAGSKIHRHFDYTDFRGKIRTTGSGVLNIIGMVIHSMVEGTVLTPCYIWDLAAAHAVIKRAGYSLFYLNGRNIDYRILAERKKAEDYLIAGSPESVKVIKNTFRKIRKQASS